MENNTNLTRVKQFGVKPFINLFKLRWFYQILTNHRGHHLVGMCMPAVYRLGQDQLACGGIKHLYHTADSRRSGHCVDRVFMLDHIRNYNVARRRLDPDESHCIAHLLARAYIALAQQSFHLSQTARRAVASKPGNSACELNKLCARSSSFNASSGSP